MNKDFSKYQAIIDQFRGEVGVSGFEAKFASVTEKVPKTEAFLLKMEIKRLSNPCTRLVDLRGHVDGECKPYTHGNCTHFLDEIAIRVFEENIALYGSYTFGVYEAVKNTENNFRVMYQKEKSNVQVSDSPVPKIFEKTQYPAAFHAIGDRHDRCEERMNFAMPIQIRVAGRQLLDAVSIDLSVQGCKFRISEILPLQLDQPIELEFTGLEQEFHFGSVRSFSYRVRNIAIIDEIQFVGVERCNDTENEGFTRFLTGFIQGNKRRYKINLDNTIAALQLRCFEQYALPKSNELAVFLGEDQGELLPKYALTCINNHKLYHYWQDENHQSTLHFLLTKERILKAKKLAATGRVLLVYSFIHHSQDKYYFYSADEQQLRADREFMAPFLGFAASKAHFAISTLSYISTNAELAYSPVTLANTLSVHDQYLNQPPSAEVLDEISHLPHLIIVADITDDANVEEYRQLASNNINVNKVKAFGHRRSKQPLLVDEIGINYRNQRQELRFVYQTPAVVEAEKVVWKGDSVDFSISGLKIELEKPAVLSKSDIVYLSFPQLQKITSAFDLKRLPYEIVHINKRKTIINLRVFVEKHQHIGRSFFKLLIDKNRHKLKADEYALTIPGLATALRNIYSHSMTTLSMMVQTSGSRYKIDTIVSSVESGKLLPQMLALSDRKNYFNLYPLLNNLQANAVIAGNLKKMASQDEPLTDVLYIAIDPTITAVDKAVTTKLSSELVTTALKKSFIKDAIKNGYFFCVLMKLSRTGEPDMVYLDLELSYISSYAIHRAKQLEQEIWSVAGVIQVFDITDETLLRYQLAH